MSAEYTEVLRYSSCCITTLHLGKLFSIQPQISIWCSGAVCLIKEWNKQRMFIWYCHITSRSNALFKQIILSRNVLSNLFAWPQLQIHSFIYVFINSILLCPLWVVYTVIWVWALSLRQQPGRWVLYYGSSTQAEKGQIPRPCETTGYDCYQLPITSPRVQSVIECE